MCIVGIKESKVTMKEKKYKISELKEAAWMAVGSVLTLGFIYLLAVILGWVVSFDSGLQKVVATIAFMAMIIWGLFITPFAILNFIYRLVRLIFHSSNKVQNVSIETVVIVVIFAIALYPVLRVLIDLLIP
jgi:sulfite exporter TauE/SafE